MNKVSQALLKDIHEKLSKPIVLIGMMGVGKSHAGYVLSKTLGFEFIDSDKEIEKKAGCSIAEIFERDGEQKFRAVEADIISKLLQNNKSVIATGGGAVMNDQSFRSIKELSCSIWIDSDVDIIAKRVKGKKDRPLLLQSECVEDTLQGLLDIRKPIYQQADIVVKNNEQDIQRLLHFILEGLEAYLHLKG